MNSNSMNTKAKDSYAGKLVRLVTLDLEHDPECLARWNQDSEYQTLLDSGPARLFSPKEVKEWLEKNYPEFYGFYIHTLTDGRLIGMVELSGIDWVSRNAWVGIGIGEREYWGKGYGTEAMQLALRFGFEQLNLNRVSLDVFGYNERAYKSYLKSGFKEEGRMRQWMQRNGERYDLIFMGILREEWEECQTKANPEPSPLLQEETT